MIGGLEGTFGSMEQLTDLAIFPFFEVSHLEHHALHIRQRGYRLLQQRLGFSTVKIGIGLQVVGHRENFVDADTLMLVTTKEIKTLVDGNTREPCMDVRIAMKTTETVPGFQECILEHIIGILMREHNPTDLPIQLFAILTHNLLEGTPLCPRILKQRQ